jgi:hypothetical protein
MTAHIRHLRTGPIAVRRQGSRILVAYGTGQAPDRLDVHSGESARVLERALLEDADQLDPDPRAFVRRMVASVRAAIWRGRRRCGRA